jgi:aminopeptidase N
MDHPAFSIRNPNKVRSLIGVFVTMNPTGFHAAGGSGYRFLADRVIELDRINPQIAARTASAFNQWTRYDSARSRQMKAELERVYAAETLSGNVSEIVRNALEMKKQGCAHE